MIDTQINFMIFGVSPIYVSILAIFYICVSFRVSLGRVKYKVAFGDGGHPEIKRRMRVQANNAEYIPIFMILFVMAEAASASAIFMHTVGIVYLSCRFLHFIGYGFIEGPEETDLKKIALRGISAWVNHVTILTIATYNIINWS